DLAKEARRLQKAAEAEQRRLEARLQKVQQEKERLQNDMAEQQQLREEQLARQLRQVLEDTETLQAAPAVSNIELVANIVGQQVTCRQCRNGYLRTQGLMCRFGKPDTHHFFCDTCFTEHVRGTLDARAHDVFAVDQLESAVTCPVAGCSRIPYKLKEIEVH